MATAVLHRTEREVREWFDFTADPTRALLNRGSQLQLHGGARAVDPLGVASSLSISAGCLSPMATCTPHVALLDLAQHAWPGPAGVRVRAYVADLPAAVVELENNNVFLAAVHARMCEEVGNDVASVLISPGVGLRDEPRLLALAIACVVGGVHLGEAGAAPCLELRFASPHRWKLSDWLLNAAARASLHTAICAGARIGENRTCALGLAPIDAI